VLGVVALVVVVVIFSGHSAALVRAQYARRATAGTRHVRLRRGDEVFILGVSAASWTTSEWPMTIA